MTDTYLYSEELPAEEVLRLRVLLRLAGGPRQATSPPSQVEQQYGAASSLTSSPASISHGQPASQLRVAQETPWVLPTLGRWKTFTYANEEQVKDMPNPNKK